MSSITTGTGEVVLPRFKLEYESLLNDTLIRLRMGPAFDSYFADFSGISPSRLYISRVIHKAVVEVSEEGTEAAAVTVVVAVPVSDFAVNAEPFSFVVDRPFFFAIRDDATGTVLFMGAVYDPQVLAD